MKRTRHRSPKDRPNTRPELDDVELDLRELRVLWSRLEEALARDGAGPSAGGSSGGGRKGSPSPIDLDTERAMVLIETEMRDIEAEAIRLLNIRPATRVLADLRRAQSTLQAHGADAALELMRLRGDAPDDADAMAKAEEQVLHSRDELRLVRRRIERVEQRRSTDGLLELLPLWYAQLRDRNQPLAKHIGHSARECLRHARDVLRLQTREERIGWQCPHHRDEPAELVRDRDEARLAESVLAGRAQAPGEAPLTWRRAESVHCPKCGERWAGVEQLRVLMRMIEDVETPSPQESDDAR